MERKELEKLAEVTNLSLTEEEFATLAKNFDSMLEYIAKITAAETSAKIEYDHILELEDLRPDIIESSLPIEDVLKNAPRKRDRYFVVPQVID